MRKALTFLTSILCQNHMQFLTRFSRLMWIPMFSDSAKFGVVNNLSFIGSWSLCSSKEFFVVQMAESLIVSAEEKEFILQSFLLKMKIESFA